MMHTPSRWLLVVYDDRLLADTHTDSRTHARTHTTPSATLLPSTIIRIYVHTCAHSLHYITYMRVHTHTHIHIVHKGRRRRLSIYKRVSNTILEWARYLWVYTYTHSLTHTHICIHADAREGRGGGGGGVYAKSNLRRDNIYIYNI